MNKLDEVDLTNITTYRFNVSHSGWSSDI